MEEPNQSSAPMPNDYPRPILLAVAGLSPQIVTETVYALRRSEPGFIPTEIHVLTTKKGARQPLGMDKNFFERRKSAINKALKATLGAAASPYLIEQYGTRPHWRAD